MSIVLDNITIGYGGNIVIDKLSMCVEKGKISTLIGPNGSGKSTIMKAMARYIKPVKGEIFFEGESLGKLSTKKVAQKMSVLPQIRANPEEITVEELVTNGRYPHLGFGKKLSKEDNDIIEWAMEKTGTMDFRYRLLETLSGGERQRAWLAMCLAQKPRILLLDEPTTFLDISHQFETLELIKELNEKLNLTIVMVLHDINQALAYSHKIYVIKDGGIYTEGDGKSVMSKDMIKNVFNIEGEIIDNKGKKYFIPEKTVKDNK